MLFYTDLSKKILVFDQKDWGISLNISAAHGRNLIYWTWFATDDDQEPSKRLKEYFHYILDFE